MNATVTLWLRKFLLWWLRSSLCTKAYGKKVTKVIIIKILAQLNSTEICIQHLSQLILLGTVDPWTYLLSIESCSIKSKIVCLKMQLFTKPLSLFVFHNFTASSSAFTAASLNNLEGNLVLLEITKPSTTSAYCWNFLFNCMNAYLCMLQTSLHHRKSHSGTNVICPFYFFSIFLFSINCYF